ncbi:hypothetical protein ACFL6C_11630 [Myxococcota bacterium]
MADTRLAAWIDKDPRQFVKNVVFHIIEEEFNPATNGFEMTEGLQWNCELDEGPVDGAFEWFAEFFSGFHIEHLPRTLGETIDLIVEHWDRHPPKRISVDGQRLMMDLDPSGEWPHTVEMYDWTEPGRAPLRI